MRTIALAAAFAFALLLSAAATARDSHPYAHAQRLVDIGDGHRLNVYCIGRGSPIVILESGLGTSTAVWHIVQPEIAKTTRVCAYDRAGLGFSDAPAGFPRDANAAVHDLHTLLQSAGLRAPYVLVGHSLGGLYVRLYADRYANDVAGLVLVDPTTDVKAFRGVSNAMDRFYASTLEGIKKCPPPGVQSQCRATASELSSLIDGTTLRQVRTGQRRYGNMPLVVLTATGSFYFPGIVASKNEKVALWKIWKQQHDEIAALSSVGVNVVVQGSGHNIPLDRPAAVISAIDDVVDRARFGRAKR